MPQNTICKTIHQYSKGPVSEENMRILLEIAEDYRKVKNYVYERYGGIGSLAKLYPGYTIQNEMTESGLRQAMGMPSVYFYLAVFDALGDIKTQWQTTQRKVSQLVGKNESFTAQEKHYLRFLLKVRDAFTAVLTRQPFCLEGSLKARWEELAESVDTDKLHRYLCRQVRKYYSRLHTDSAAGFSASKKAYRHENHGIYLATKENRKRIFIPLTDGNKYDTQIYVRLQPENASIIINVPIQVTVRSHQDYEREVGVAMGIHTMLTTDGGRQYGEKLGEYQNAYAEWIREQASSYSRNRANNPGRKKYNARKGQLTEQLHSYINHELNRFLQEEKPKVIYLVKLPKPKAVGVNRKANHNAAMWQRGYIRQRLTQKCQEHSVELVDVLGKDISNECSCCGAIGSKKNGVFLCGSCGYSEEEKTNTAKNVLKRGQTGKVVY